ncbi:hypothetical protein D9M71_780890 [compost metagenome]
MGYKALIGNYAAPYRHIDAFMPDIDNRIGQGQIHLYIRIDPHEVDNGRHYMVLAECTRRSNFQSPSRCIGVMYDCSFQSLDVLEDWPGFAHIPPSGIRQCHRPCRAQ